MSQVSCPICTSGGSVTIQTELRFGRSGDVRQCSECGLVFLDQSSVSLPDDFYEGAYHQTYLTHVEPAALDPEAYYQKMLKVTEPWANRFQALLTGTETVLDVGCSTGHFLDLIKGQAGAVYGHELNLKEIEFCRHKLGLDVSNIPLKERFAPGIFDYITMFFVLEHIADPRFFLQDLMQYLKPDGKMLIIVPNHNDALVSMYDLPDFKRFYYCNEHLFYFNNQSLSILLDQVGMVTNIEVIQEYPITNHLNWIYRKVPEDSLNARAGLPDAVIDPLMNEKWDLFWKNTNLSYERMLLENGYGDRLWCMARIK